MNYFFFEIYLLSRFIHLKGDYSGGLSFLYIRLLTLSLLFFI